MVSEVSFGTIPVLKGSVPVLPAYYNLSEEQALAVMEHAFRLGCNLYDTAIVPEYGDAERKTGLFASGGKRDRIIISDKARFFDGNEMYMAVLESCESLGTWPDIYFVHQADWEHEEEILLHQAAKEAALITRQEIRDTCENYLDKAAEAGVEIVYPDDASIEIMKQAATKTWHELRDDFDSAAMDRLFADYLPEQVQ